MAAAKTNPASFYFITAPFLLLSALQTKLTNRWNIKINFEPITISFNEVIKCPQVSKSPMTQAVQANPIRLQAGTYKTKTASKWPLEGQSLRCLLAAAATGEQAVASVILVWDKKLSETITKYGGKELKFKLL